MLEAVLRAKKRLEETARAFFCRDKINLPRNLKLYPI